MSAHGEYRAVFVALADDQDAHALSGDAFKLYIMLWLALSATGIGPVYASVFAERVGCTVDDLEALYQELEAPTPGHPRGWLCREGNVVWLFGALATQPNLKPTNDMHVKSIEKRLANLNPNLPIVRAFVAEHPQWFPPNSLSIAPLGPIDSPSSSSSSSLLTLSSTQAPGRAEPSNLPAAALQLLDRVGPEGSEARKGVLREMRAVLDRGHLYKGQPVRATAERLGVKCRATLDAKGKIENPWAYTLAKLADTSDGSAPGAQEARQLAAPDPDAQAIDEWIRTHDDEFTDMRADVLKASDGQPMLAAAVDLMLRGKVREILCEEQRAIA